jgi:hypothetical protein
VSTSTGGSACIGHFVVIVASIVTFFTSINNSISTNNSAVLTSIRVRVAHVTFFVRIANIVSTIGKLAVCSACVGFVIRISGAMITFLSFINHTVSAVKLTVGATSFSSITFLTFILNQITTDGKSAV